MIDIIGNALAGTLAFGLVGLIAILIPASVKRLLYGLVVVASFAFVAVALALIFWPHR